jgi:RNA 3'-terminal phosphate cyclase-like protein
MSLKYEGCTLFRQRIIAATLSGKVLKIVNIRKDDKFPGLQEFEANFLQLIDKITDGNYLLTSIDFY